jgi:glycosyltransferase involved in cell wall biosynthesis
MRIAHINNVAGVSSSLAKYQRKRGHEADVFVFNRTIHNQFGGNLISYRWNLQRKKSVIEKLRPYDVWHYHYPFGSLKKLLEKGLDERVYLKHYHGSDIRGMYDDDFCIVSTPDLLRYARNGKWLPNPIDLEEIESIQEMSNIVDKGNVLRVAHYPYYQVYKEQDYHTEVLADLQNQGKIDVIKILGVPHRRSLEIISSCDIVVGKILPRIGWFGKTELEGMALSKPVMAYVSDDLYEKYKPPIFRTTVQTFRKDIESIILDGPERESLGKRAAAYINEHHSADNLIEKLDGYYQKIYRKPR